MSTTTINDDSTTEVLPERIRRFPFPFPSDSYRYSTNVEPAGKLVETDTGSWGSDVIDVDEYYLSDLKERAKVLAEDPTRTAVLPHMRLSVWDAIVTLLSGMAEDNPQTMSFAREGNNCRWVNSLQDLDIEFVVGDDDSLPTDPMRFLGSQIQDDIAFLDPREDTLWLDAGLVTFAADWSFRFDVGMKFMDIHTPVPRVKTEPVITRAHKFLVQMQPGEKYRRLNWTMTVGRRLDTSTESYPEWAQDRSTIATDPDMPDKLHLRVEVQSLLRLPHSGALLFLIRSYLLPLTDIARVPAWRERLGRVLAELPEDMAEYKGIIRYRDAASAWLLDA